MHVNATEAASSLRQSPKIHQVPPRQLILRVYSRQTAQNPRALVAGCGTLSRVVVHFNSATPSKHSLNVCSVFFTIQESSSTMVPFEWWILKLLLLTVFEFLDRAWSRSSD